MIKNRYRIGNAQTIGRREIQSNYFTTEYNDTGDLLAVLADGTIDHPNGRKAAIIAVEHCIDSFLRGSLNEQTERFMIDTALNINKRIKDAVYIGRSPRLSLTVVLLSGETAHYFNVGANKILLYNGHNERAIDDCTGNPYASGRCNVSVKNVIGIFSIGACTMAHPMERLKIIKSEIDVFDKAQAVVDSVNGKWLDNQLNTTVLLVEVVK
jgi:hypothetical protein